MTQKMDVVGIDVSKATLDAYALASQQARQFANDPVGHQGLVAWLQGLGVGVAVLEASGGYEQAAARWLRRAGLVVHIVDPKRVRHYARAAGQRAKTDRIDARMIAEFGAAFLLAAQGGMVGADDPARQALVDLVAARQDLLDHRTSLQQQADALPPGAARRALLAVLKPIARAVEALERRIAVVIARHPPFAELARRLDTVPGLGPVSITALIAWLPELGQLTRRQLAALVGVAPFADDSGARTGQRRIQGGRMKLRNVLYMATMSAATRHNPVLHACYSRLLKNGKKPKVALIACLRKLLTILNVMVARQQDWNPTCSQTAEPVAA
jgi:transposase